MVAPQAHADHSTVQATATGQVAATDNVFAAGSNGDRQPDTYLTVRPGVIYAYDAPQMIHDFSAEAEMTQYLIHTEQPLLAGSAGWHSRLLPGPRSQLSMSIGIGTGILTALSSRTSSDQTFATVTPIGKVATQQSDAGEQFSWISSEHTRVSQDITGRYSFADGGSGNTSDTREVSGNFGFERTFPHDTVGLQVGASYLQLTRNAATGPMIGTQLDRQIDPRGMASWRHDFNRAWSGSVDGGLVFVHPLATTTDRMTGAKTAPFTVFSAQLGYSEAWGHAALVAHRNIQPNLYLAVNTLDDGVNLQVAMPLPWLDDDHRRSPRLAALGSVGVSRTQTLDAVSSAIRSNYDVAHMDLSVAWTPRLGQTFGLRYELVYQTGDTAATMAIPAFYRNSLYVTFALRYPDRSAGEAPRRYRSMRSDRRDLRPLGMEEVVPDPLEPEGSDTSSL